MTPTLTAPRAAVLAAPLQERELVALWLLGRVPAQLLPWPLLRAGRAGRGPGPDVREAAFAGPDGVVLCGDVEVHLAATDFVHHGHLDDPAYADVVLHLVWRDDRSPHGPSAAGGPQPLPGRRRRTHRRGRVRRSGLDPARLRRLLRKGPRGAEPCAPAARARGPAATAELVRAQGRRRLAERAWHAASLAAEHGWDGAWEALLDGALRGSAGRRRETPEQRGALAARLTASLSAPERGDTPQAQPVLRSLRSLSVDGGARPRTLIAALRGGDAVGPGRAAEVGWNAALPLLAASAAAFDDPHPRTRHRGPRGALARPSPLRPHARPRGPARPAPARRRRPARPGPPPPPGSLVQPRRLRAVSCLLAGGRCPASLQE